MRSHRWLSLVVLLLVHVTVKADALVWATYDNGGVVTATYATGHDAARAAATASSSWGDFFSVDSFAGDVTAGAPTAFGQSGGARGCGSGSDGGNCTPYLGLVSYASSSSSSSSSSSCSATVGQFQLFTIEGQEILPLACTGGCEYFAEGAAPIASMTWQVWAGVGTGNACGESTPAPETGTPNESGACFELSGQTICAEQDASSPTINGTSTEHTVAEDNNCFPTSDGGTMVVALVPIGTPKKRTRLVRS